MGGRGSLSTIVAGVLVLMAMVIGILIGATALSMITTLGSITANHVREVGVESAMYSGLVTQGNELISTRGPITIIGAVTPRGFTWINKTTQYYVANTTEPELLLTSVGPVLLDPTQTNTINWAAPANPLGNYLWHWVVAVVTTNQGQNAYSGLVEPYGSSCYLVHINPNYLVGPLTSTNTYVTKDYGAGVYGCDAVGGCPPTPPGGPVTTNNYAGYWPQVSVTSINSTTVDLTITFPQGTSFIRAPQYFSLYVLSQDNPIWLNPYCTGQHVISPNNCTFDMTWIQYPYQQGSACYNGGWIWCTLPSTVTYNIIMNMNAPVPNNYYLIMIIQYPTYFGIPAYGDTAFAWNITGTSVQYPTWLYPPSPPANVLTPG
jgi:hypothetical protein